MSSCLIVGSLLKLFMVVCSSFEGCIESKAIGWMDCRDAFHAVLSLYALVKALPRVLYGKYSTKKNGRDHSFECYIFRTTRAKQCFNCF